MIVSVGTCRRRRKSRRRTEKGCSRESHAIYTAIRLTPLATQHCRARLTLASIVTASERHLGVVAVKRGMTPGRTVFHRIRFSFVAVDQQLRCRSRVNSARKIDFLLRSQVV